MNGVTDILTGRTAVTDRLHIGNRWLSHSGLNRYENTARMHDPLLMRFGAPDPLWQEYPGFSPWSHCAANQSVNPVDLEKIEAYSIAPGMLMMHEMTGAYEGAKISLENQVSSSKAGERILFLSEKNRTN